MRHTLVSAVLCAFGASMLPGGVLAATIIPFGGVGNVLAGLCSPMQTDPAACFVLSDSTNVFSVGGVAGYRYEFAGVLVPNPDPDAFPFPTYDVGSPYSQSGEFVLQVPEPGTFGLLLAGLLGSALRRLGSNS